MTTLWPHHSCRVGTICFWLTAVLLSHIWANDLFAEDWPTYRHDNDRSAVTQEKPTLPLVEAWVFQSRHAPAPAWEPARDVPVENILELPRVRFDDAYHVVAAADALYFGSSADGKVSCLDAAMGRVRWTFFTGGPVRLAPTLSEDRVYVGSDDGHVYCLNGADGKVVWQRRVGPGDDRLLGRGKMISMWPVRTGVLVDDGVAYYGAGIFPSEGVYMEAVRAADGQLLWRNDTGGEATETRMSPQGYLLATADKLFAPQGRVSPSAFDRKDGHRIYEAYFGKTIGGTTAQIADNTLYTGTEEMIGFDAATRAKVAWFDGRKIIVTTNLVYMTTTNAMLAVNRQSYPKVSALRLNLHNRRAALIAETAVPTNEKKRLTGLVAPVRKKLAALDKQLEALPAEDSKRAALQADRDKLAKSIKGDETKLAEVEKKLATMETQLNRLNKELEQADADMQAAIKWRLPCECPDSLILANGVLFGGGPDNVIAVDVTTGEKLWEAKVKGKARGLALAEGRLYASTDTGAIHCFAPTGAKTLGVITEPVNATPHPADRLTTIYETAAESIVRESGVKRGFCLVLGCETGRLALELAKRTELTIIGIEPDAQKVAAARKALDAAGVYGARVTVEQGDLDELPYAAYFANLIVSDTALLGKLPGRSAKEMYRVLKPLGGVAMIGQPAGTREISAAQLRRWLRDGGVSGVRVTDKDGVWAKLTRDALPGAGSWTHAYAEPGNTTCGDDQLIKAPLGLLWYGDPGPLQMVTRHARAAAPLSVNGVLFVQGEHAVNAYDAYNGFKLWDRKIPNVVRTGVSYQSSNLAADDNSFYVVITNTCLRLDATTGEIKATYVAPAQPDGKPRLWGDLRVSNGVLLGTGSPSGTRAADLMFAFDTKTGQLRWSHTGNNILNTSISIGDGRVFFAEGESKPEQSRESSAFRRVTSLALATGQADWSKEVDLTGCVGGAYWGALGSMYKDGTLLFFGVYTDGHFWQQFFANQFNQRRIVALASKDGDQVWAQKIAYRVRPLIIGDTLHAEPWAFDLKTGQQQMRVNPITGRTEPWQFARPGHHCGTPAAAGNLLMFRSWNFAYYDLANDFGTVNFGGQRTGCWINFIVANGLVMVPEASSGCMCAFPNMCTVVFAPRKENRAWGKYSVVGDITPVKHLAVNLGGPGDRRDAAGTLWLGYPRTTGSLLLALKLGVDLLPGGDYFEHAPESMTIGGTAEPWLYTFGGRGVRRCEIPVLTPGDGTGRYTVRLGFAEIESTKPGDRVFDIQVQGKPVLKNFDVVKVAGGQRKVVVKEFKGILATDNLAIELVPKTEKPTPEEAPILQTIEVVREAMLTLGVTVPSFTVNDAKPKQTAELRLANYKDADFTGTLRVTAPAGIFVTPAEALVEVKSGAVQKLKLTAALDKPASPGKYAARIQLVRRDGGVEFEQTAEIEYMGPRGRLAVAAVEDAYVAHGSPTKVHGQNPSVLVDGGDQAMGDHHHQITFLKFKPEIPGKPVSAVLRLYNAGNPTSQGGKICLVTEPWSEKEITYERRPKLGDALANIGRVKENQVLEIPLKLSLDGVKEVSLAIEPVNTDGVNYISREGGKPAELIIEYEK